MSEKFDEFIAAIENQPLTETEKALLKKLSEAGARLHVANEVLRSCYQVAARGGKDTNWPALTTKIGEALN